MKHLIINSVPDKNCKKQFIKGLTIKCLFFQNKQSQLCFVFLLFMQDHHHEPLPTVFLKVLLGIVGGQRS